MFNNSILTGLTGLADRTRFPIEWPLRGMMMDRRRFIEVTAVGMVAGVTGLACAETAEDVRALARPDVLEMLGAERTREIGARYRATVPAEQTVGDLHAAIMGSQRRWHWGRSIRSLVHDDFEAGRTVLVGGWVLSQTEARQCALYSLSV